MHNPVSYTHLDVYKRQGMALATALRPRLFSEPERENGRAAWLLGASFISEGAIPFAAADPLRVIAASMAGSAVTGGLIMAFGSALRAPHGGIWVIALINNWLLFLVAVIVGMVICAVVVVALKGAGARRTADDTQVVSATSTVGASAGA